MYIHGATHRHGVSHTIAAICYRRTLHKHRSREFVHKAATLFLPASRKHVVALLIPRAIA